MKQYNPKHFPSELIYNPANTGIYRLFNTKNGDIIGRMSVEPRVNDLFIQEIEIERKYRGKNYGNKLLKFAVKLSKTLGFSGNLRGIAGSKISADELTSHIFCRKFGFEFTNPKVAEKVDEAIRDGKKLYVGDVPLTYVFFKPEK